MRPNVTQTQLPSHSSLHPRHGTGDFMDCYCVESHMSAPDAAKVIVDFPSWAKILVVLRNWITAPFGLMADGPDTSQKLGLFPVESTSDTEVILGFNDRHLNFRVSVLTAQGRIYLATWVRPHNIGGRLYLKSILPFHILIVRNALARVASEDHSRHKSAVLE